MRRNIDKAITEGRRLGDRNQRIDISVSEINEFKRRFMEDPTYNGLYNLIVDVFCFGLAVGNRNR